MSQAVSLVLSLAFVVLFRKLIKARPSVFYVLAAAIACFGVYCTYNPPANDALRAIAYATQKGQVGFAFLAIVMFVGTFEDGSAARKALQPIRGELSIVATILMTAHFVPYVAGYARMLGAVGSLKTSVIVALGIAAVVLALLAVLGVTSLQAVKRAMRSDAWKRVQGLAYVFFALVFFHLLGYLLVPVGAGSTELSVSLAFYVAVYVSYAVSRTRRAFIGRCGRVECGSCAARP